MAFVQVAEAASLSAGTGTTVTVNGRDYALFHLDGEFFCIDNECPHRDGNGIRRRVCFCGTWKVPL